MDSHRAGAESGHQLQCANDADELDLGQAREAESEVHVMQGEIGEFRAELLRGQADYLKHDGYTEEGGAESDRQQDDLFDLNNYEQVARKTIKELRQSNILIQFPQDEF